MYAIVVEQDHDLPVYINVYAHGTSHTTASVISPPPERFQYSSIELPCAMAVLKRDYPHAFIAAHEVDYIDHTKMCERWARKSTEELSGATTAASLRRLGIGKQ
jgi:hypothetical protein